MKYYFIYWFKVMVSIFVFVFLFPFVPYWFKRDHWVNNFIIKMSDWMWKDEDSEM